MTDHVEDVKKPELTTHITDKDDKESTESMDVYAQEYMSKFLDISNNAKENDSKEKNMSLKEGIKTFPKAAMWSVILSSAIVMEGYDLNLINSFYTFPSFVRSFGEYYPESDRWEIPARWQTGLSMAVNCGQVLGLFIVGFVSERLGYRKTMISSLLLVTALIFIVFFAQNITMLLIGEILLGLPWGAFQAITLSYASEVCPTVLRLYLTTYVNVCWVIGQLISSAVLRGLVNSDITDSWKIPFGLQWVWPVPIAIGVYFAPESPWWLVKKGRYNEAKHSLERLLTENEHLPDKSVMSQAMVDKIKLTIKEEEAISAGVSFKDCFKKKNIRRTRISCLTWLMQNITGSAFMGYSTYFYLQAGLSTSMSFTFSIIQYVLGIIGTLVAWFTSQKLGRYDLYFNGMILQFLLLVTTGILGCFPSDATSWVLALCFWFGPITYCLVTEMPSASLRTKTVILARNCYNIAGIIIAIIMPYMLNPTAWNWKAKTGFFWAGFAFLACVWCYLDMPETKNRTFAELDHLFEKGVPARKFKSTNADIFDVDEMMGKLGDDAVRDIIESNRLENSTIEKV
ncbi:uncharacterized protein CXQ87_003089 [Candidozyma duobushaemuli]|uniref:Major facilitator superfamily (MFS) profile domain-containing protein n=1 Tax=Candidozyma duobushaemuli TaxID=1231522 RepID=A0A2V1AEG5_9ASCO|nr:uncharacterized protein CXQ87_003089 [[Candida] duobushaemulonis]PVH15251.1 hypothetical protein CXQ87_003089 [[Candida] duobushaemulonis]